MRNNYSLLIFSIILILLFGLFILALIFMPIREDKVLNSFCEENNYSRGDRARTIWEKSYCIQEEKMTIIKDEVEKCGDNLLEYCFVKGGTRE